MEKGTSIDLKQWEIPSTWKWIRIGDVCDIIGGGTPNSNDSSNFEDGQIPWITPADLSGYKEKYIHRGARNLTTKGLAESSAKIMKRGAVLFSSRAPIGYVAIAAQPMATNQGFKSFLPPDGIVSEFIYYYLQFAKRLAVELASGTTFLEISAKKAAVIPSPLPPLPEQHRIVAKIEELFSELDKSVESLKTAQQQLKVYRQAVLKWAFEGKLTEEWRTNQKKFTPTEDLVGYIRQEHSKEFQRLGKKSKMIQPLLPEVLITLPTIPAEWSWLKINDITTGVEYGTSSKSSEVGTVPVIRMGNIQNSKIVWDDLVFTSDETEIGKYKLQKDDVLFNRTNSPELVGKTAIFLGERTAIFAGYLIRLNHIKTVIHAKYLNYYLNSFVAKSYGNSVKTDGVNQSNINGEKLINYPLPICSIEEQHQIVLAIESRLSVCDKLEETISHSLKQAEALRQSILQQAFAGKLVPQDPQDEPAAALLARIRSDREATAPAKKAKATKGRKK